MTLTLTPPRPWTALDNAAFSSSFADEGTSSEWGQLLHGKAAIMPDPGTRPGQARPEVLNKTFADPRMAVVCTWVNK